MFYAFNVDGEKIAPEPKLSATCPCCGSEVIAKCGSIKLHHWAHKNLTDCDTWYAMTDWHLEWQKLFSIECREVVIQKGDTKHRADVKISNLIIELQHSNLSHWQIDERELFYGSDPNKLIWIIDSTGGRVFDSWKEQLRPENIKPIFFVDQESNIYFELIGYSGISITRKLSLPIGLLVGSRYPAFIDLGEYIACRLEKTAHEITGTKYCSNWGWKNGNSRISDDFILVEKRIFVNSLPFLPTKLNTFKSLKLCDRETLEKRSERIAIAEEQAKRYKEDQILKNKRREELANRRLEAMKKEMEQWIEESGELEGNKCNLDNQSEKGETEDTWLYDLPY